MGIFGLIAALASARSGWKATALPSPSPPPITEENLLAPSDAIAERELSVGGSEKAVIAGDMNDSDSSIGEEKNENESYILTD